MSFYEKLVNAVYEAIRIASIKLPRDVEEALKKALEVEENEVARSQLETILLNAKRAWDLKKPICQDTGLLNFYVKVGFDFPHKSIVEKALIEATKIATRKIPLRPNAVDPFTNKNSGDNTGVLVPHIEYEFYPGDKLVITVVPKGGGSEAVTRLELPPPGSGLDSIKKIVLKALVEAGGKPCPPVIIGVGVGGCCDKAVSIAKKAACLRKVGVRSTNEFVAKLEEEILDASNKLGIGPMGLGGKTSVLDVHIEYAYRHPATYPVAVVFQCWATRRAFLEIDGEGSYRIWQ